jgi:alkanesulfonate monooxygenase SsuD/methylene tetrahydromethanopterin reductase-like flavin-dependent oxidoreductase (luciferase family)
VGGGGEKKTLKLLARHGDIGHWFGGNLEDLKRKKQIFEDHCEAEERDPSTVLLTVGLNFVLVENQRDGAAVMEKLPPERRAMSSIETVQQAAETIRLYQEAGFGGFTFGNVTLRTPESIALAGELISTVNGKRVAA